MCYKNGEDMQSTAKLIVDKLNKLNNEEDKFALLMEFSDEFPFIEEELIKTMNIIVNKIKEGK